MQVSEFKSITKFKIFNTNNMYGAILLLHFIELDNCESWISALILTICFACLWMFNFSYLHNNVFQVGKPEGNQEAGWGWCPADGDYPQS